MEQKRSETYNQGRKGYSSKIIQMILKYNPELKKQLYVDVGCGTGILTYPISKNFKKTWASDLSDDRIIYCLNKFVKYKNINFQVSSAEKISAKDATVDLVTAAQAYMYFNKEKFLKECMRVLKPGGVVAILWKYPSNNQSILNTLNETAQLMAQIYKTDKIKPNKDTISLVRKETIISDLDQLGFNSLSYQEIPSKVTFTKDELFFFAIHSFGFSQNNVTPEIEQAFKKELFKNLPNKKEFVIEYKEMIYLGIK